MADPLDALAARLGVVGSYTDQLGRRKRTTRATRVALLRAMGIAPEEAGDRLAALTARDAARPLPDWLVCDDGKVPLPERDAEWHLTLEDGTAQEGRGPLPALPLGLHRLEVGGHATTLISAPRRLPRPARSWGVMLPLHALRPPETGGLATYADLGDAGTALAGHGADYLGLNPIHAGFWGDPGAYSPYAPSHRRRLNAFFLDAPDSGSAGDPLIDYAREIPARRTALEAEFAAFDGAAAFERFKSEGGAALHRFALHQALSDRHGPFWRDWPAALHDPESPAVREAAAGLGPQIDFHLWLQWRAETELAGTNAAMRAAGMATGLYLDLAVGTHPLGAETWEDRDSFGFGASLGAPPDAFSAEGQSWGLAPFNPAALISKGFAPLAETLRRQLQFCGALRIDHILGFDRAFWVPGDGAPGTYVRMPRDAMLAVLRMEAARAGAAIVGEDLGNVPRGLRAALDASGVLGCQVQVFERAKGRDTIFKDPGAFSPRAVASFSTHDLPTWRGWREGHEIATHRDLGHIPPAQAEAALAHRRDEVAGFDAMTAAHRPEASAAEDADTLHAALAATRSAMALVQIETVLDITAQPNLPGTTTQYPNWRQRLPLGPGALAAHPGLARTAGLMAAAGRAGRARKPKQTRRGA